VLSRVAVVCMGVCAAAALGGEAPTRLVVRSCKELAKVWAGHPVGFAFATREGEQYVGFYDRERRMVIGRRTLDSPEWTLHRTQERTGWDSHNRITFGFDRDGHLHLTANMHCRSLRYWRTERPGDVASLKAVHRMTGRDERRCTYPRFLHTADGRLLFFYRDGGSGNGRRLINVYDEKTRTWARYIDRPLLSGEGKMNAYPTPILTDRGGVFHIAWVWRDTPDCSTNHHVSYARSRDLRTWTTSDGRPVELPMTLRNAECIDPVAARGGLLNNVKLSFDARDRPLVTYHKFDAKGKTQLYTARLEKGGWKIHQTTAWDYRWYFKGGGSIHSEIRFSGPRVWRDGRSLVQGVTHPKVRSGARLLDGETLQPAGPAPPATIWPPEVRRLESKLPGMRARVVTHEQGGTTYVLKWETLGANRDRPRSKEQIPPPSRLLFYELVKEAR